MAFDRVRLVGYTGMIWRDVTAGCCRRLVSVYLCGIIYVLMFMSTLDRE